MSTTFEIGRIPAAETRAFSHGGDGPTLTSVNTRPAQRGHSSGASIRPRDVVLHPPLAGRLRLAARPRRQVGVERGRHLAGDAVHREAVGPVGGDLELHHLVGDRQHLGQRGARLEVAGEQHDPLLLAGQLQLALRQDHPVGLDAPQARLLQHGAARHRRPGQHDGHRRAGLEVGGAAHDAARLVLPHVHRAHREAVGVGMLLARQHAADAVAVQARGHAAVDDPLELGARHREQLAQLLHRQVEVHELAQPRDRHPHPNCSIRRRSFSHSSRMSGMAWRAAAIRSTPKPQA